MFYLSEEPIFDRTEEDVVRVKNMIEDIKKNGLVNYTYNDIISEERGCLSLDTIDRIIGNIESLWYQIFHDGYMFGGLIELPYYTMNSTPSKNLSDDLIWNLQLLLWGLWPVETELPTNIYRPNVDNINALEKILFELDNYFKNMYDEMHYANDYTVVSGNEVML